MARPRDGAVLLLCLLFLVSLALLGLSASAETVMQDMLAANLQENERARQSALAAQQWAEQWLLGLGMTAPVMCDSPCQGLRVHGPGSLPGHPESEDPSWWTANGYEAGVDPLSGERHATLAADSIAPPTWLIEQLHERPAGVDGDPDRQVWYRILARGSGHVPSAVSVIESIVSRPWRDIADAVDTDIAQQGPCPGFEPTAQCARVAWRRLR